jgi:hypothetical protein
MGEKLNFENLPKIDQLPEGVDFFQLSSFFGGCINTKEKTDYIF